MNNLWKDILAEVEIEVSKPIFLTFFKTSRLISLNDSIATVGSSTDIGAEYLKKRYYSLIKKLFDKKIGKSVSLVFKHLEEHADIN